MCVNFSFFCIEYALQTRLTQVSLKMLRIYYHNIGKLPAPQFKQVLRGIDDQFARQIDIIVILELKLSFCIEKVNEQLTHYMFIANEENVTVLVAKKLPFRVIQGCTQVISLAVHSNIIFSAFYVSPFHKLPDTIRSEFQAFLAQVKQIDERHSSCTHILLGDCNLSIFETKVRIILQTNQRPYGVQTQKALLSFLESKKFVAYHTVQNESGNFLDLILARSASNITSKVVSNPNHQINKERDSGDHRKTIIFVEMASNTKPVDCKPGTSSVASFTSAAVATGAAKKPRGCSPDLFDSKDNFFVSSTDDEGSEPDEIPHESGILDDESELPNAQAAVNAAHDDNDDVFADDDGGVGVGDVRKTLPFGWYKTRKIE